MIFNVEKKLYFKVHLAISCIFTKGCFFMGQEGGSENSHPAHNSRDIKCYFLMIFNVRKKLYCKVILAIACIITNGCLFMG